jgi:hypothetical protein
MKKLINKVRAIIEGRSHLRKEWDRCEKKLNNKQITSVQFHDRINEARVFAGSDVIKRSIFTVAIVLASLTSCEESYQPLQSCGEVTSVRLVVLNNEWHNSVIVFDASAGRSFELEVQYPVVVGEWICVTETISK